jgi:hypothetical protein
VLHQFLATNRAKIIARTREKVAARPAPRATDEELENGIPLFLDQLIDNLRLSRVSSEAIELSATIHGRDLLSTTVAPLSSSSAPVAAVLSQPAWGMPAEWGYPITVMVPPDAICSIHPEGAAAGQTMTAQLSAGNDGLVRLYRPASAWGTTLALDCSSGAGTATVHVNLGDDSTFMIEPDFGKPPTVTVRPPLSADPTTVSQADLRAGGYPPRPDPFHQPTDYARWLQWISIPGTVVATKPVARLGFGKGGYQNGLTGPDPHWGGQILYQNPTQYIMSFADFIVPSHANDNGWAALWGGLGFGGTNNALIQNGVWLDPNNATYLWYEYIMGTADSGELTTNLNPPIKPGDEIQVWAWPTESHGAVSPTGGYSEYEFYDVTTGAWTICGITCGQGTIAPFPSAGFGGLSAEVIVERPACNPPCTDLPLTNYGRTTAYGGAYDGIETYHNDSTDNWGWSNLTSDGTSRGAALELNNFNGRSNYSNWPTIYFQWQRGQ